MSLLTGNFGDISGEVAGLIGDVSLISGDVGNIFGDVSGAIGDISGAIGDLTGLTGDFTGFAGEVPTLVAGDFLVFNTESGDGTGIIFGEQSEAASQAQAQVADLQAGDVSSLGSDFALQPALDMDYQAYQASDSTVVLELLTTASEAGNLDLQGSQWAGALSTVISGDPTAIGIDLNAAAAAMDSNDILGMSDDAALVVLQSAVLNVEGGDDAGLQQNLAQYSDQLDGYLTAISDYDAVDDGHMVAIMQNLNLGDEGFDLGSTVLQGNDVSSMVASLDLSHLQDVGVEGLLNTTSLLDDDDVAGTWGVQNALDVINTVGAASMVAVDALEGIASAFGDGAGRLTDADLANVAIGLNYDQDVDLTGFSIATLTDLDLDDAGLLTDDIVGLANTAALDLLSALPEENLNEILNVPLEDLQGIDTDRLPELLGGLREDLAELLPDVQVAYLLSDEGLDADYLNSGASSFNEIATAIGGSADAIFELLADNPDIPALDDLLEGASDIFASLFS